MVIPQCLYCKHLHDLTGARAYMAGIYEKQGAIKFLFFKEAEERACVLAAMVRLKAG